MMANQIQNKLLNFEAQPPAGLWEKIAAELDEATPPFVQRLQQYEVKPDDKNWEPIAIALDKETLAEKGFFQKHRRLFVYSSAAAAILLIAFLVTLFVPNKTVSNEVAVNNKPAVTKNNSQSINTQTNITITSKEEPTSNKKETAVIAVAKIDDSRYVTVTKDDGKTVRLSKKILDVYKCATNEINERCKERIESLQEKAAASLISPTADFAGFVELVKNLKEEQ
jgi:hypothetical protein